MPDDTRDMVIRLERDVKHLTASVEELTVSVTELNKTLERSRGAVIVLGVIATGLGFVIAKATLILGWFGYVPK